MLGQSFFWKYPQIETVILRPVHIIGAVRNAPSNYLRLQRPWVIAGYDPMIQVVHEADVARAIGLALLPEKQGIFNLPGCVPAPLSQLLRMAGCSPRSLPHLLADPALRRLWAMRLTSFPAPELDHLRFVCMVDGEPARDELEFSPRYDLAETMEHLQLTRLLINKR